MNEKKSPDEEQIEDSFSEDFDFGEGETEMRPVKTISTTQGLNKKIVGGIFIVIFAVLLIMGYRIFNPSSSIKPTNLISEQKFNSVLEPKAPTTTVQKMAPSARPPEQNFGDIAQAFSTADETHPAPPISIPKANTKESSLEELQKELFSLEQKPHLPETKDAVPSQETAPTKAVAPTQETPTPEALAETGISQLTQNLNKLNQQINYILSQINHLDSYSREISESLDKLNETINVMDTRLSALTNTTSTLSKDVGNVKNEVGHVKQVLKEDGLDINLATSSSENKQTDGKGSTIAIEEPEYTVHAVIPGRAWLKSTKGQIITVAEGDAIGNYGKILVIDAANGVVLTSSGIAFR